MVVEMWQAEMV